MFTPALPLMAITGIHRYRYECQSYACLNMLGLYSFTAQIDSETNREVCQINNYLSYINYCFCHFNAGIKPHDISLIRPSATGMGHLEQNIASDMKEHLILCLCINVV